MKKRFSLLLVFLLLIVSTLSFIGCKNDGSVKDVNRLSYEIDGGYSLKKTVLDLDPNKYTYDFNKFDGKQHVVVTQNSITATRYIYDLSTGEKTGPFWGEVICANEGLYIAKPITAGGKYTVINLVDKTTHLHDYASASSGVVYADDATYFTNPEGNVVKLVGADMTKDFINRTELSYLMKVGDYYLKSLGSSMGASYRLKAYGKDGFFVKSFDVNTLLSLNENEELETVWNVGNLLFAQTTTLLLSDASEYDFIRSNGVDYEKYDLNTYSYDLETNALRSYETTFIADNTYAKINKDYAVLKGYKIDDKNLTYNPSIVAMDNECSILVDFDQVLAGTSNVTFTLNKTVQISDTVGNGEVYSTTSGELLTKFITDTDTIVNKVVVTYKNEVLVVKKLDGSIIKTVISPVNYGFSWNNSYFYVVERNPINNQEKIYFYDTATLAVDEVEIPAQYDEEENWYTSYSYTINAFYYSFRNNNGTQYDKIVWLDKDSTTFTNLSSFIISTPYYANDSTFIIVKTEDAETEKSEYCLIKLTTPFLKI